MGSPLAELSLSNPVIAAPMAGEATTPELVIAAAPIGSLGLLLAPDPMPVSLKHFHDYAGRIQTEADAYGVDLRKAEPVEDDDEFHDKIDLLLSSPVPVVGFTFGFPDALTIQVGENTINLRSSDPTQMCLRNNHFRDPSHPECRAKCDPARWWVRARRRTRSDRTDW
jgi:hypothetical protein